MTSTLPRSDTNLDKYQIENGYTPTSSANIDSPCRQFQNRLEMGLKSLDDWKGKIFSLRFHNTKDQIPNVSLARQYLDPFIQIFIISIAAEINPDIKFTISKTSIFGELAILKNSTLKEGLLIRARLFDFLTDIYTNGEYSLTSDFYNRSQTISPLILAIIAKLIEINSHEFSLYIDQILNIDTIVEG